MRGSPEEKRNEGGLAEALRVIAQALIIALLVRTLLFQPFNIPSGSMEGTLLVGDYLFVSTYSYGYTHYSLPFSPPLFPGRIWASPPTRLTLRPASMAGRWFAAKSEELRTNCPSVMEIRFVGI